MFYLRNIDWRRFTPTNGINRITSSVSHLYLPGIFYSIFQILSFFPSRSNHIYHILYKILFEIHRLQLFNKCFFFFGLVDNTLITVLMLIIILFVFVIIICVFHGFHIFNRIILISTLHIIFISMLSICSLSIIIIWLLFKWFQSRIK